MNKDTQPTINETEISTDIQELFNNYIVKKICQTTNEEIKELKESNTITNGKLNSIEQHMEDSSANLQSSFNENIGKITNCVENIPTQFDDALRTRLTEVCNIIKKTSNENKEAFNKNLEQITGCVENIHKQVESIPTQFNDALCARLSEVCNIIKKTSTETKEQLPNKSDIDTLGENIKSTTSDKIDSCTEHIISTYSTNVTDFETNMCNVISNNKEVLLDYISSDRKKSNFFLKVLIGISSLNTIGVIIAIILSIM